MGKFKVAMIAPPWLKIPPDNYGGTEFVVDNLCRGLDNLDVDVELFTVKGSITPTSRTHWFYDSDQFNHIHKPMYDAGAIPISHVLKSLDYIREAGDFDIIHDHNHLIGPAIMRDLPPDMPPVLHTLHGPLTSRTTGDIPDAEPAFSALAEGGKIYFNGISWSQLKFAPLKLKSRSVGAIHHGIDPSIHPFIAKKQDYFVNVGRVAREKGIHIGARIAGQLDVPFKFAGVIAGIADAAHLATELNTPDSQYHNFEDFIYYRDQVQRHVIPGQIEYVGAVNPGPAKDNLLGNAKAFLCPITWEEPFGVAMIDALVVGTPVVAMRRGSLPEIIEHGVNGFLADNTEEFRQYMTMVDQIDPADCRRSVEERFTYQVMAKNYLSKYQQIASKHRWAPLARPAHRQLAASFYEQLTDAAPDIITGEEAI